jgi:hypothetical protein
MPETGRPHKLLELKGSDLLGVPLKAWFLACVFWPCPIRYPFLRPGIALPLFFILMLLSRCMLVLCDPLSPQSPCTPHDRIYVLPLLTILMNKARTGGFSELGCRHAFSLPPRTQLDGCQH